MRMIKWNVICDISHIDKLDRNDKLSVELLRMLNSQSFGVEQSEAARERERVRSAVSQLANRVSMEY